MKNNLLVKYGLSIGLLIAIISLFPVIPSCGGGGGSGSGGGGGGPAPAGGILDTSFGNGGKVTTNFGPLDDEVHAVAIQADGRIVGVGSSVTGTNNSAFAAARYNIDGSIDTSFGTNGKVITDFGSISGVAYAAAIQKDGKIVAAGIAGGFALSRYNTDGSLDTSFGSGGKVITDFGSFAKANAVVIQTDGRIVATGLSGVRKFALARYNTDGSLDTNFGTNGLVTTEVGNVLAGLNAAAIQTDGKIVVAGWVNDVFIGWAFVLARYNVDGSLDPSFGIVTTDFGGDPADAYAVAIQADGKIVAAGGTSGYFALARYNTNGNLDTSFGSGGKVVTACDGFAHAVVIQKDGKIVAAGHTDLFTGNGEFAFFIARYNTDGSVDTSFGNGGKVITDFGPLYDEVHAVAIQANGRIVAVGPSGKFRGNTSGADSVFALARYWP